MVFKRKHRHKSIHYKRYAVRKKKLTQQERIKTLEKAVATMYAMIQAVIQKLPEENNNKDDVSGGKG